MILVWQIKHVVLQMAELIDPKLKLWVEANTTFPNTMVDRITPVTEAEHIELVARCVPFPSTQPQHLLSAPY